ncbi:MAG: hypothetical protein A2V65_09470 [Deltaproteobacteria bacterium RBG_13_49_15]|nr:MAG: hypothetical protein A2V65_09470 [Deltaproteobacteria bacterium RBG_13_49_15]
MVTQREVAKKARVSIATVSRYINKVGYVSPEVKSRIKKAIKELNYIPNLVARSLKLKSTEIIGMIFPDIENPFFISLIKGAEETARKHNYNIMLCNSENKPEKEQKHLEMLKSRLVGGMIIIPSMSFKRALYESLNNENVVFVDRSAGLENEVCLKLDNRKGVAIAIDYLSARL